MISFDPSEIEHWASQPDAPHRLTELIRRLILATVPMPVLLHMPSGSSVWRPGWDGLLVVETGNAWVPDGTSAWEFSCQKNPKRKASDDYGKRTKCPKDVDVPITKFVFVTPRRWDKKDDYGEKWASDHRGEGQWADVRALDANSLAAWLEQAPAVAHWFARLIGKLPATGAVPLDEWWENWSRVANPPISPQFGNGRPPRAGGENKSVVAGRTKSLLRARRHTGRGHRLPSRLRSCRRDAIGTSALG